MTYRDEVLADGPFAAWSYDETSGTLLADELSNHDATAVGGPDLTVAAAFPGSGSAVGFDGVDDHANHTTLGAFGAGLADWSAELWVRTTQSVNKALLGVLNDGGTTALIVEINFSATDTHRVFLRNEAGANVSFTWASAALRDGAWHHLVVTYDRTLGSNQMKVYQDGSLAAEGGAVLADNFANFAYPLFVAARNNRGPADMFALADLDWVALYPAALSAARIQVHYDAAFQTADPANLQAVVDGSDVNLTWDPSF